MPDEKRHFNPLIVQHPLGNDYDSIEFTLATGQTDYNVRANVSAAFKNLDEYTTLNIRATKEITIKFNKTTNTAITLESGRPFELDNIINIREIYITNASGTTASIKIIGTQKEV